MEFIPGPFQIFERIRNAPWSKRIDPLLNRIRPVAKNVKGIRGINLGGPVALLDAGVRVASGENPLLASGRALAGWGGGALGTTLMAPVPIPGARLAGGIGGYGAGTALFDNTVARATDDRGLSGLLQGKGWNNPFAPSPSQPQISNIGVTPKEFQVGGKYGPSEEALIDIADDATLYNQKGEYIGGVLPEGDGLDHRATWLHKTRNSPAAQAGHSENARWGTYLGNQAWRKDHGRSYDTSIDHLLKPSSENKRVWNVFGNEVIMDDNKIPVTQKVDTFLDNVPAEVIEANIAKNDADKAKVNSGEMTAAEYFGTNIR